MECWDKAKEYYEQVIKKEPSKHDGYIELANMLKKNGDLEGAIDVYAGFPINEVSNEAADKDKETESATYPPIKLLKRKNKKASSSFDDAFIYGELVSLVMSAKKYDDQRLPKYLILWAKIMGTGMHF